MLAKEKWRGNVIFMAVCLSTCISVSTVCVPGLCNSTSASPMMEVPEVKQELLPAHVYTVFRLVQRLQANRLSRF